MAIGLTQMVSAGYLGVGIKNLYKLAKHGITDDRIDLPQLRRHLAAFVTYLTSTVVYLIFYFIYSFFGTPYGRQWANL